MDERNGQPEAIGRRLYVTRALAAYWPKADESIVSLPIPIVPPSHELLPPRLVEIELPPWAADLAPQGTLPVPAHCVTAGGEPAHEGVDWFSAAFWYLNGSAERAHELRHGPVHSYSFRLRGWPSRMWEHAWVNRIALFLRRWAARAARVDELSLLGPLPTPQLLITHDVDAVRKTWSIRVKQSVFHAANGARYFVAGDFRIAARKIRAAARFACSRADYWMFDELLDLERARNVSACFMVYGRARRSRTGILRFMDPGYDVVDPAVGRLLQELLHRGHTIGLHPSFGSWGDGSAIREERERVEQACNTPLTICRQHWLRFSWARTWAEQQRAGLALDMTLGFNDRPGFRNGAAIRFAPLNPESGAPLALESVPLILMDSQLYDYAEMEDDGRAAAIRRWIGEVLEVGGTASVIWHPHTLSPDYGWRQGFRMLLDAISNASADLEYQSARIDTSTESPSRRDSS